MRKRILGLLAAIALAFTPVLASAPAHAITTTAPISCNYSNSPHPQITGYLAVTPVVGNNYEVTVDLNDPGTHTWNWYLLVGASYVDGSDANGTIGSFHKTRTYAGTGWLFNVRNDGHTIFCEASF